HQRNFELVETAGQHRQTNQSAAIARHEVDGIRRHLLVVHLQVPFVLAILVVANDDHPALAESLDGVLDSRERAVGFARPFGDLDGLGGSGFRLWHGSFSSVSTGHIVRDIVRDTLKGVPYSVSPTS